MNEFESKITSQNGEDGIIQHIFEEIGATNKFFLEIGVDLNNDQIENNTLNLLKNGWQGVWLDKNRIAPHHTDYPGLKFGARYINAENINDVFKEFDVPQDLDFVSIDVDGNDYHLWNALTYQPRVICIEFNQWKDAPDYPGDRIQKYNPAYVWEHERTFGSSKSSLIELGKKKGYRFYCEDNNHVNLFFVKE